LNTFFFTSNQNQSYFCSLELEFKAGRWMLM
jgi:hypothetical protein